MLRDLIEAPVAAALVMPCAWLVRLPAGECFSSGLQPGIRGQRSVTDHPRAVTNGCGIRERVVLACDADSVRLVHQVVQRQLDQLAGSALDRLQDEVLPVPVPGNRAEPPKECSGSPTMNAVGASACGSARFTDGPVLRRPWLALEVTGCCLRPRVILVASPGCGGRANVQPGKRDRAVGPG
jgi:hypothetical protein